MVVGVDGRWMVKVAPLSSSIQIVVVKVDEAALHCLSTTMKRPVNTYT